jgi:hypothetical protein
MANKESYGAEYRTYGKCRVYLEAKQGHPTPEMDQLAWIASTLEMEKPGAEALGVVLDGDTLKVHIGWSEDGDAPTEEEIRTKILEAMNTRIEATFDPSKVSVVVEVFDASPDKETPGYSHGAYLQDAWQTKRGKK